MRFFVSGSDLLRRPSSKVAVRPGELLSLTQAPGLPDGVYEVRMRIPATAGPREPLNFVIDDLPRFEFLPHVVYVAAE